jgi:HD-GYP domain-containing protein (c-di-GMP phosphodiesterase class II)
VSVAPGELRLGELLAALSLAGDLANGMPLEKTVRTCLLAVSIGRLLGLDDQVVSDTFYVSLLRAIGCTAFASEEAAAYGDDIAYRHTYFPVDFGNESEVVAATQTNLARDELPDVRAAAVQRFLAEGPRIAAEMATSACSVAVRFSARLGMSSEVATSLTHIWERWDGQGFPAQLCEEQIAMPARLAQIAIVAEIDHRVHGRAVALEKARQRRGGWFDPIVADAVLGNADVLFEALETGSVWELLLDAEPTPRMTIASYDIDRVISAFGDFVDLKSPFTLGHSSGVARLAEAAGAALGVERGVLYRAGCLHDLGTVSVSSSIWNKPGPLTTSEWERVRLHA